MPAWQLQRPDARCRRSSSSRHNTPGTIDSGYRGEVGVILANFGDADFTVKKGDKIAQAVIAPVTQPEIVETDTIDETDRGAGGFGSTGV